MKKVYFRYTMVKIDSELGVVSEEQRAGTILRMTDELAETTYNNGLAAVPLSIKLTLSHMAELQGYTLGSIDFIA